MKKLLAILIAALTLLSASIIMMSASAADGRTGITMDRIQETVGGEVIDYAAGYYCSEKRLEKMPQTFEAWVYLPSSMHSDRAGLVFSNYPGSSDDYSFSFEIHKDGIPRLLLAEVDGTLHDYKMSKAKVKADVWTHVAVVHGGGSTGDQILCYIDGKLMYTSPRNVWFMPDKSVVDNVICLAGDTRSLNSQAFRGVLGDVTVYGDIRTPDEIKADMSAVDLSDPDLLAHYDISEDLKGKDIPDASGNGHDMTYGKMWLTEAELQAIRAADPNKYAYSIAFIPDTQYSTELFPENLSKMYDWLAANAKSKNIQYVISLGDITNGNTTLEWATAKKEIEKLNGIVPYSLIRGNHDITKNNKAPLFDSTFGRSTSTYYQHVQQNGGMYTSSSVQNTYLLFSVGDIDYIILNLDFGADDSILAWANTILKKHTDRRAIVATHGYLLFDGTTLDGEDHSCPTAYNSNWNNGDDIWEKLICKHENIDMVVCGHMHADSIVMAKATGDNGNTVYQLLIDPQNSDKKLGGLGMVAMMYFTEDGDHAVTEYYSTVKNMYFRETTAKLSLDFSDGEQEQTTPPAAVETTPAPEADTTPAPEVTTTPAPEADTTPVEDKDDKSGCGSAITTVAVLPALLCTAVLVKRKRK